MCNSNSKSLSAATRKLQWMCATVMLLAVVAGSHRRIVPDDTMIIRASGARFGSKVWLMPTGPATLTFMVLL